MLLREEVVGGRLGDLVHVGVGLGFAGRRLAEGAGFRSGTLQDARGKGRVSDFPALGR